MLAATCFALGLLFSPLPQASFHIQGRITDERNNPVRDLRVTLVTDTYSNLGTVYADVTGRFKLPPVTKGTYYIQVDTTGTDFEPQERRVDLASIAPGREVVIQDFMLRFKKGKAPANTTETLFAQSVPEAAQAEYRRAVEAINGGRDEEAVALLTKAVALFPDYFQALETLGAMQVRRGQHEEAIKQLTHAVEVNPKGALSYYSMGMAHLNLKQFPAAIEALRKSASINPTAHNTQLMLGYTLISNRQFEEAEAPLKLAYQHGGAKAVDAQQYLAVVYDKLGRFKEAAAALEIYIKEAPKDVDKEKFKMLVERLKKKAEAAKK
jgi:tetratricopeptide (TPR) repeat protein